MAFDLQWVSALMLPSVKALTPDKHFWEGSHVYKYQP